MQFYILFLLYEYCVYIGHGGNVRDRSGDEADGRDETLIPLDYARAGQITDDILLKELVLPMAKGVFATSIMDCCHSGTILDLPYRFTADGKQEGMEEVEEFGSSNLIQSLLGCTIM